MSCCIFVDDCLIINILRLKYLASPGLRKIHDMITITQPQIEAICWAAERHVRSLKRSGSDDHEHEINEIQGWIEALDGEYPCEMSFVRLANLLKMYPIKQLEIQLTPGRDNTEIQTMIQLVAQQTKTLNRLDLNVHNVCGLKKLLNWLSVFDHIEHCTFTHHRDSTEVLELIASLPINSLCITSAYGACSLSSFIRTNKTIEHLELFSYYNCLPSETLEALKENRTLKVGHFSHSGQTFLLFSH